MGPKRAMSRPEWLATQRIYRDYGKVAGITVTTALLSTLPRWHSFVGGDQPPC